MSDNRNIIDYYKYWETEAIKADLDTRRFNYGVICANIQGDFNLSTVVRNANAFLAKEVLIYGRKKYDRRGTVGTHNYTNFKHVREIDELDRSIPIIAVDNVGDSHNIENFSFPDVYFYLAFGEENLGVPPEILEVAQATVYIKQYGSVRSLNVGCASAIAMYQVVNHLSEKKNGCD